MAAGGPAVARRPARALRLLRLAALLAATGALLPPRGAGATTFLGDKQALLAFRDGLSESSTLLEGWSEETDPCGDRWTGIRCDCQDYFYSVDNTLVRRKACTRTKCMRRA